MADITRFTELLLANQSLDDLLNQASEDEMSFDEEPWKRLARAAECLRSDEKDRALALLQEIVNIPNLETRILLWSWTALRNLGVNPKPREARAIMGVVIEVPMGNGNDILAAYADGTARYVNHTGKIIVWDLSDTLIRDIISKLLESCKYVYTETPTRLGDRSANDSVKVTVLTLGGNRCTEIPMQSLGSNPINEVLTIGAELMEQLIKRTEARNL
jgi:hypothetical protein